MLLQPMHLLKLLSQQSWYNYYMSRARSVSNLINNPNFNSDVYTTGVINTAGVIDVEAAYGLLVEDTLPSNYSDYPDNTIVVIV